MLECKFGREGEKEKEGGREGGLSEGREGGRKEGRKGRERKEGCEGGRGREVRVRKERRVEGGRE